MIQLTKENKEYIRVHFDPKKDKYGIVYWYIYADSLWIKVFEDGSAISVTGMIEHAKKFDNFNDAVDDFKKTIEPCHKK